MAKNELIIKNCIRQLRFQWDEMSQSELASRVGVTRQTIHAIETQKYTPSLELAFKIALVFQKGIEEVFEIEQIK